MKRLASLTAALMAAGVLQAYGAENAGASTALPVKEIILYTSGVGYFERSGNVDGNAAVQLRFDAGQINDLLKSLVVRDFGGNVGVISYDSRDPLSKTLGSFAIDLTSNPSMRDLLNQTRGEKVKVIWPNITEGTILGVEQRQVESKEDTTKHEDFLNLFTGAGLKSIPLSAIQEITFQNATLQKELNEALTVLARGHDTEKKSVTVRFDGNGQRQASIAYIVEAPVWKTSYRLVLGEEPFIQGWAMVENTSDEDWQNVQLSLVSGRPISFRMDLYEPLYVQRPTVKPELFLSLRPQTYADSLDFATPADQEREVLGRRLNRTQMAPAAPAMQESREYFSKGLATNAGGGLGGGAMGGRGLQLGLDVAGLADGVQSSASGAVSGELFQYVINQPVSIARQKSAMLPILTEKITGEKISIYNESVQAKHPLNGFKLKNTTDFNLMQGPVTVFDEGSYAGDAQIADLAPGQDRLISYAVDLKTEVAPQSQSHPSTIVSARINRGTFFATKKQVHEKTYTVKNKDQKSKTVLIEHPVRADWKLESVVKPTEQTRDQYRFKVDVEPGKTEKLVVQEGNNYVETALITELHPESYGFYLRSDKLSAAVKAALRKAMEFREQLAETEAERKRREERLNEIGQEQGRIRENMARLTQNSDLYQRYVKKFDEQETEFERLRMEAAALKDKEAKLRRELSEYLSSLDIS